MFTEHNADIKPMNNFTVEDYRYLAEAARRFHPGPMHDLEVVVQPEPENPTENIANIAEVFQNQDSHDNEPDNWEMVEIPEFSGHMDLDGDEMSELVTMSWDVDFPDL